MRTLYYYFAVIARSIEGDESDAAILMIKSLFNTVTPMAWLEGHTTLRRADACSGQADFFQV